MPHDYSEVVPHIYPIILNCSVDRDEIRLKLEQSGIQTGLHYKPNHHLSFYRTQDILKKTGIEKRYIANNDESAESLALQAIKYLLFQ